MTMLEKIAKIESPSVVVYVPDVVGGVRVRRSEDALAHEQRLHAHLVGVADDVLELVEALHLEGVLVGGDGRRHHHLRHHELPVAVPGEEGEEALVAVNK